jgi:ATP-dependent DNA ligase
MADDSNMERRHIDTMWKQKDIQVFYSIRTFLLKLDGYRALASKQNGKIHLRSRNDNDFNGRYPSIVRALAALPDETVVDGEIVALGEDGRPSFHIIQNYGSAGVPLYFYVFDLLLLKGGDVMREPLSKRREYSKYTFCRN